MKTPRSTLSPLKTLILPLNPCHPLFQPVSFAIFHSFLRCTQGKRPFQNQSRSKNPYSGNEITIRSYPPLHTQPSETSIDSSDNLDLDLPIAVRKGTRECTNRPLYPLSHYVSLKHLSPAHKNFIVSLNTTIIPNTVSEALIKRE